MGLVQQGSASILATDDFQSYTPATALTGGAGGTGWGANLWLAPSGATTLATVNGGGSVDVTLSGTATTLAASRLLDTGITQTFYASFVVNYQGGGTNDVGNNNTFGLVLSDLTTPSTSVNSSNVINFGIRGATANTNEFGIRAGTATGGSTAGGLEGVVTGADYLLVAKLTYSGGLFNQGDLWINPGPSPTETSPDATLNLLPGAGVSAINSVFFRQAANQTGDIYRFDNLILATEWNDIVPVPEPMSGAMLLMGGMALWMVRRQRA